MKKAYYIDDAEIDLGYQEHNASSYRLDTYGKNMTEMMDNAQVVEIDVDGVEVDVYDFAAAPEEVQKKAVKMITTVLDGV